MGGILRKFVENENDDDRRVHDERQHRRLRPRRAPLHGLPRAARPRAHRGDGATACARARGDGAHRSSTRSTPGEVDIPEVQDIKRIIRESEAVSGIEVDGADVAPTRDSSTCRSTRRARCARTRSGRPTCAIVRAAAARAAAGDHVRGRRPVGSARHAPDVQGSDRRRAGTRCTAARPADGAPAGVAVSRRVAGVADDRGHGAVPDVAGRADAQDPGDLQAPVAEGLHALPRPGRARVLAARGAAQQGDLGANSISWGSPSTSRWRRMSSRNRVAGP